MLCWGGVTLAMTSFSRRRSVPGALAGLVALSSYLFDYVARIWKPAVKVAWAFPFHYFNGITLISGRGIPWKDILILLGYAVCGATLAYIRFARRDL
jgi:hypothetical protein